MKKKTGGLLAAPSRKAERAKAALPIGECLLSALLLAGTVLFLTENLPSVSVSPWHLTLGASFFGAILLFLYPTRAGKWLLPIGLAAVLGFCLLFREKVLEGFACLGNDVLALLTAKTGRIFLDFSPASPDALFWALLPISVICVLLVTRGVFGGRVSLLLPILLPAYAATLLGLVPCGVESGLLAMGTVLLAVQRTGADAPCGRPLGALPVHFLLPGACIALCLLLGSLIELPETDARAYLQEHIHEAIFDDASNSMPEGKLKNLSAWDKSDTPALEVSMEQPGKLYLRGAIYETYTSSGWQTADTEETASDEDLFYWLHRSGFYGQSQLAIASELTGQTSPVSLTVKNLSACSAHGYYPYGAFVSELADAQRIGDTNLPVSRSVSYYPGGVTQWYRLRNSLSSAQGRETIAQYLALEQAYGEYVERLDLQLTQESWSVIDRQLALQEDSHTIGQIRELIRNYLDENLSYDESIRTLNGDGDFLQYTLERSGCGYSVHYATAAVLMLRYFGVPARYVEGYFLSAEEAASYLPGETITLTENHAHAWAEYYVEGVGFVPFEVTPGYVDAEELEGFSDQPEQSYQSSREFAQVQRPESVDEQSKERSGVLLHWSLLFVPVLLLLALLLCRTLRRRRRLRRTLAEMDKADNRQAIALRYGYASLLLSRAKIPLPEGADEARAFNREALFSAHEMSNAQRQRMDDYARHALAACRQSWNVLQKLRYRFWDGIY